MALVSVKDAQVVRVNRSGFGVQVKEQDRQANGKTFYGKRFTVWFTEPHGLVEGDVVSVSGFLAAEVSEWEKDGETKRGVQLSVNSPRLEGFPEKPETPAVPAADVWSAPVSYNDESPF